MIGCGPVKCARQTIITPDVALSDVAGNKFDVVALPGGQPGSNTLARVRNAYFIY